MSHPANLPRRHHILSDHKKVGTKFVPPMVAQFPMQDVRWVQEIVPELIWLGLLNAHLGPRQTVLTLDCLAVSPDPEGDRPRWFGLMSSFNELTDAEWAVRIGRLGSAQRTDVETALSPLTSVIPDHPLSPVSNESLSMEAALPLLSDAVAELMDRRGSEATWVQAHAHYVLLQQGLMTYANRDLVPNLNSLSGYPQEDEAQLTASRVRGTINAGFHHWLGLLSDQSWATRFWSAVSTLEACTHGG